MNLGQKRFIKSLLFVLKEVRFALSREARPAVATLSLAGSLAVTFSQPKGLLGDYLPPQPSEL